MIVINILTVDSWLVISVVPQGSAPGPILFKTIINDMDDDRLQFKLEEAVDARNARALVQRYCDKLSVYLVCELLFFVSLTSLEWLKILQRC